MGKKIYLFELDSVRKTDNEVKKGLFTLYEEIVYNGNTVVVSFNQLVDSRLFLCMLKEDDYFKVLITLFKNGNLLISRYGEFRTISQYVQNSIKKNLAKNSNSFIFSGLPVKSNQKFLMKLMQRVLINADLSELTDYIDERKEKKDIVSLFAEVDENGYSKEFAIDFESALNYLRYVKRFLELVLIISISENSYNPAKRYDSGDLEFFDLMKFIEIVIKFDYEKELGEIWGQGIDCLKRVKKTMDSSKMNDRSNWIKTLKLLSNDDARNKRGYEFTEVLVNLCYNYTIEASMANISKHYNLKDLTTTSHGLFKFDFLERLKIEWANGKNSEDKYLQDESNDFLEYKGDYPNWEIGLRVLNRVKLNLKSEEQTVEIPLYESNHEKQRKRWKHQNKMNVMRVLGTTLVYMALLILANILLSAFQNEVGVVVNSLLTIIVFMILSELVCDLFKLPSIFECINSLKECLVDFRMIVSKKEFIAYKHSFDIREISSEQPSDVKEEYLHISDSIEEYIRLWDKRSELFSESDSISIVDPRTKEGKKIILGYEVKNDARIGVLYKSPYNMWVVDLIRNSDGAFYTYERMIHTVPRGAVLVVAKYLGEFVLLRQFRHALRGSQLAFPRGYGEINCDGSFLSPAENVEKEVHEELGAEIEGEPIFLGEVVADSGISGNFVSVYTITIKNFEERTGYEGIEKVMLKTEEELDDCIKNGEITDGFTLSGYLLYKNNLLKTKTHDISC